MMNLNMTKSTESEWYDFRSVFLHRTQITGDLHCA